MNPSFLTCHASYSLPHLSCLTWLLHLSCITGSHSLDLTCSDTHVLPPLSRITGTRRALVRACSAPLATPPTMCYLSASLWLPAAALANGCCREWQHCAQYEKAGARRWQSSLHKHALASIFKRDFSLTCGRATTFKNLTGAMHAL